MTVREFLKTLTFRSIESIKYNVYIHSNNGDIDLSKQKNHVIEKNIANMIYVVIGIIGQNITSNYNLGFDDELNIKIQDLVKSIIFAKQTFNDLLNLQKASNQTALNKVSKLNEDIFNKIPILACDIFENKA